ncbi:hypothetical protein HJC23_004515 [Cyclotella cryptica]|uniref:Uncharacterized protein n=1 Tax=Cyclotella cryptica TaxID=29204 RepID=A0ABD3NZ73_9STRA|eukprot:CCRYP_019010-RA/>CCRYP_019010-RA protein AED:0.17 eAED:0.17 QI:0/-1/0/1/-1/1/1/0/221
MSSILELNERLPEGSPFNNNDHGRSLLTQLAGQESLQLLPREVAIAEYSELRVFDNSRACQFNKSFSSADFEMFRSQVSSEASRIRDLISSYPLQTGRALQHVVCLGLLSHDHIVGIEHLICKGAAANIIKARRSHVASVLEAQELLKDMYGNSSPDAAFKLAMVANKSSSRSVKKAQIRAIVSLNAGELFSNSEDKSAHVIVSHNLISPSKIKIRAAHAA